MINHKQYFVVMMFIHLYLFYTFLSINIPIMGIVSVVAIVLSCVGIYIFRGGEVMVNVHDVIERAKARNDNEVMWVSDRTPLGYAISYDDGDVYHCVLSITSGTMPNETNSSLIIDAPLLNNAVVMLADEVEKLRAENEELMHRIEVIKDMMFYDTDEDN